MAEYIMACADLGRDISCEHAEKSASPDEAADRLMEHIRGEHSDRLSDAAARAPQQLRREILAFLQNQALHAQARS